jgi:signal transduction histidine kinase/CheY-like chemotaxis protein
MNDKLQVLLVEDKQDDADLIREMLSSTGTSRFAIHCVSTLFDAVNFLDQEKADIALLDLDLPDSDGPDIIHFVRKAAPNLPIVVMAGNEDEQVAITAVKAGAQDYLLKGKTPSYYFSRVLQNAVERKLTEERVRESERLMRSTLDALLIHIAIIDSTGKIVRTNKAWKEFTISNSTEAANFLRNPENLNTDLTQSNDTSVNAAFAGGIRSVLNNEENHFEMEYSCQSPTGLRWFYGRIIPFYCKGLRWVVVVHEDITARKEAEIEKIKLATQLRHTKKMEAIGTLAGGIAHDFNNILSAVLGFTELCLSDVKKGSLLEKNMREVYIAGSRAKDLIKQMLTFAGKDNDNVKPIQISSIAREVLNLIQPICPPLIEIQHQIKSDALVMANPIQIHQVFMNLCTNALKAMELDRGKLSIRIAEKNIDKHFKEISNTLKPGRYITIEVEDSGSGIPKDKIDRIFEPYFTTYEYGEGSGLELAMVHSIIKRSKGEVQVRSEVGKGTSFLIYLPISEEISQKIPKKSQKFPGGKESILFVDDELAIVNMNKQALSKLGYKVASFSCSLEALKAIKTNPDEFDLVITDMTMPDLTGEQLAEEIIKINPDLPIILCTGYSRTVIGNKIVEMGIKAIMMKPIPIKQMASKIRSILDAVD